MCLDDQILIDGCSPIKIPTEFNVRDVKFNSCVLLNSTELYFNYTSTDSSYYKP